MSYLLDTNMVIALTKGNRQVIRNLRFYPINDIFISSITVFELYFGAYNGDFVHKNIQEINDLGFKILDFDSTDGHIAGRFRAELARIGKTIGAYDVLIAGQAVNRNLTLITDNVGELSRIAELKLENWLR